VRQSAEEVEGAGLRWLRQETAGRVHYWPFDDFAVPACHSVVAKVYPRLFPAALRFSLPQFGGAGRLAGMPMAEGPGREAVWHRTSAHLWMTRRLGRPGWRGGFWGLP